MIKYNLIGYKKFHINYDNFLQSMISKYNLLVNPNLITISSLFVFIPLLFFNNLYIRAFLCFFHDFLDRLDGSMARVYIKNNILRDSLFGAYLDALCDKIYVLLFYYLIIKDSYLLQIKVLLHLLSIIVRTLLYFSEYKSLNKSNMNGKLGTFLENISFCFYFISPNIYPFLMIFSIYYSTKSLLDKLF